LRQLDAYLRRIGERFVVGTVSLRPHPWSKTRGDMVCASQHRTSSKPLLRTQSKCAPIAFPAIRFDEGLVTGEDGHVIAQARKKGNFFFMQTKSGVYVNTAI